MADGWWLMRNTEVIGAPWRSHLVIVSKTSRDGTSDSDGTFGRTKISQGQQPTGRNPERSSIKLRSSYLRFAARISK